MSEQPEWEVKADVAAFGRHVRTHQRGTAVILEVDGLCIIGDAVGENNVTGAAGGFMFPRKMAICPTLADAKRALELSVQQRAKETGVEQW